MSAVFRVLVVCTGNLCRSPTAEAMLRKLFGDRIGLSVTSAGLSPPIGAKPHALAVKHSKLLGYEVNPDACATPIDPSVAARSNLILVMDRAQKLMVVERYPVAQGKTFLLGHWGDGEIEDPIGRNEVIFASVARKIETSSAAWAEKIVALTGSQGGKDRN